MAMIVVALLVTSMMAMGALVLDAGQDYSTRRHMQNAADAAAIAATRSLDRARFSAGLLADVDTIAQTVLAANDASTSAPLYSCTVIDKNAVAITACSNTDLLTGWPSPLNLLKAVGVKVTSGTTRKTAFGAIAGMPTLTASTTAAATIQPLLSGDSPFMACGFGQLDTNGLLPLPDVLSRDALGNLLTSINPLAVGKTYTIHGPGVANCNSGSQSFKGLAGASFVLPGWIPDTTGVRSSPQNSLIVDHNACVGTNLNNCTLVVPICDNGRGTGTGVDLHCTSFASFYITAVGSNKHLGVLQPGAIAVGGQTSTGDPVQGSVRAVKLVT